MNNKRIVKPLLWWIKLLSIFVVCFYCGIIYLYSQDKQNQLPNESEEWLYVLTYDNFRFNIMAYEYNKTIYLPLNEITSMLQIFIEPSESYKTFSGYIIRLDSTYELNTESGFIESRGKKFELNQSDYIKSELEIFVTADVLQKLFGVQVDVFKPKLEIKVTSKIELPVLLEYKRQKKYSKNEGSKEKMFAPLISGRQWHLLNGGVLEYQLTGQKSINNQGVNYNVNTGLELLGGELKILSSGSYNPAFSRPTNYNLYEWNYAFAANKYLTQVKAGNISNVFTRMGTIGMSNNIATPQLLGVQITNETFKTPATFTNFVYEDKIEPGWTVELYLNNRLYAQTISDPNGYYKLEVPVSYGNSSTMLKFYSPYGDYREVSDEFFIPSEFIDPGELKYTITGGKTTYGDNYVVDCRSSLGITKWLTTTLTYQKQFGGNTQDFMAHIATRLPLGIILNTDISPKEFYATGLRYYDKKSGSYDLILNKYDQSSSINAGKNYSIQFSGNLPRFKFLPFNLGMRGSHDQGSVLSNTRITSNLNFSLFKIGFGCNYNYSFIQRKLDTNSTSQSLSGTANYSWLEKPKWLSFLGSTSFNMNLQYDIDYNKIRNIAFSVSQGIKNICYVQMSGNRDFVRNSTNFNFGVSFNLSTVRTSTNTNFTALGNSYSQNIQGNVAFDATNFGFDFSGNSKYNGGGLTGNAKIRLYIDENLNSKYDRGEKIVPDIGVKMEGGGSQIKVTKKGTYLNGLDCSERYNVTISSDSFKNPLLLPAYWEFSIITNPNSVKSIDVPCYYSGIIEGAVTKQIEDKTEGQAGVKVHFRNKDNGNEIVVPVYSDGTFYQFGMIPGKYIAYVDTLQVSILECISDPVLIEFEIKSLESGDYFGDLKFALSSKSKRYKKKIENQEIVNIDINNNSAGTINRNIKPDTTELSSGNLVSNHKPDSTQISNNSDTTYTSSKYKIQLLASRQPINVKDYFANLLIRTPKLTIKEIKGKDGWYRYCAGGYDSLEAANESVRTIKKNGWKNCFVSNKGDEK